MPIEDEPAHGRIISPHWTDMPSADLMADFYPKIAWFIDLKGLTRMECQTTSAGTLEHCKVTLEQPTGVGFAAAALQLAPAFHLEPRMEEGAPVGGDSVDFNIAWRLPPKDPALTAADPPMAPLDPESLALGRRLAVATGVMKGIEQQLLDWTRASIGAEDTDTQNQAVAVTTAVQQSIEAKTSDYLDIVARTYASEYSKTELRALVAFMESPVGQAWTSHSQTSATYQAAANRLWIGVTDDARRRFCSQSNCYGEPNMVSSPSTVGKPQRNEP
jgi:hypothetical protein